MQKDLVKSQDMLSMMFMVMLSKVLSKQYQEVSGVLRINIHKVTHRCGDHGMIVMS